jgi:hypothetical protein
MPSRTTSMSALAEHDTSPSDSTLRSDGLPAIRLSDPGSRIEGFS